MKKKKKKILNDFLFSVFKIDWNFFKMAENIQDGSTIKEYLMKNKILQVYAVLNLI